MPRAIVIGAGPGGLSAALALSRVGFSVELLEQAPSLRATGAGLTVQPNAHHMLTALVPSADLQAIGTPLLHGSVTLADGRELAALPLRHAHHHALGVHRGALSTLLAAALPPDTVRFGAQVVGVDPKAGRVSLSDGDELTADVVIGADGIHSVARRVAFGQTPPRYAGYTCWRGLSPVPHPVGTGVLRESWGRGLRFGIVPLSDALTYWFATANAPEGQVDGPDPAAELRQRFAAFADPTGDLIDRADTVLRHDIVELPRLKRWTTGRLALLGDAAHAMTPNLGQGACQAVEDAVTLAAALASAADLPAALARWEADRRPRVDAMVDRSRWMGRLGQLESAPLRWLRDLLTRATPEATMARSVQATWEVVVPGLG